MESLWRDAVVNTTQAPYGQQVDLETGLTGEAVRMTVLHEIQCAIRRVLGLMITLGCVWIVRRAKEKIAPERPESSEDNTDDEVEQQLREMSSQPCSTTI